jgi:acetoacetyl-CoA synthetase
MMWNWLVSSLATGATLVLYDGNPFHPSPKALWQMAQDEKITVFGTSAGYLAALQAAGVRPREEFDLSAAGGALHRFAPVHRKFRIRL